METRTLGTSGLKVDAIELFYQHRVDADVAPVHLDRLTGR